MATNEYTTDPVQVGDFVSYQGSTRGWTLRHPNGETTVDDSDLPAFAEAATRVAVRASELALPHMTLLHWLDHGGVCCEAFDGAFYVRTGAVDGDHYSPAHYYIRVDPATRRATHLTLDQLMREHGHQIVTPR